LAAVAPLGFTALRLLDLSDNLLRAVPPSIAALCCLESLSMQRNQLTALPDELGALTRLKVCFCRSILPFLQHKNRLWMLVRIELVVLLVEFIDWERCVVSMRNTIG
jgi:Leucine-rich repeat (LRR) protein